MQKIIERLQALFGILASFVKYIWDILWAAFGGSQEKSHAAAESALGKKEEISAQLLGKSFLSDPQQYKTQEYSVESHYSHRIHASKVQRIYNMIDDLSAEIEPEDSGESEYLPASYPTPMGDGYLRVIVAGDNNCLLSSYWWGIIDHIQHNAPEEYGFNEELVAILRGKIEAFTGYYWLDNKEFYTWLATFDPLNPLCRLTVKIALSPVFRGYIAEQFDRLLSEEQCWGMIHVGAEDIFGEHSPLLGVTEQADLATAIAKHKNYLSTRQDVLSTECMRPVCDIFRCSILVSRDNTWQRVVIDYNDATIDHVYGEDRYIKMVYSSGHFNAVMRRSLSDSTLVSSHWAGSRVDFVKNIQRMLRPKIDREVFDEYCEAHHPDIVRTDGSMVLRPA